MFLLSTLLFTACHPSGSGSSKISTEDYEQTLTTLQMQNKLPGFGTALLQDDTLEVTTVGVKKYGEPTRLTPGDTFHLGSCSKAMTATLAAILIEEGYFTWTSKLSELLPDINLHPDYQDATFEMLLSHRAGLISDGRDTFPGDYLFIALQNPFLSPVSARDYYANKILPLKPQVSPGSKFIYSNGGYIIAAHIMEELTGNSWETLIKEKLFDPLAMDSCGTGPTWGHYRFLKSIIALKADNPPAHAPAAGIHCSMKDWGKFLAQHLRGYQGESGIVSAMSFKKLHTVSANDGHNYTYGGWGKHYRDWANGYVLTHNGSNTFNFAQVWIAPELNSIFMTSTNIGGKEAELASDEALAEMIRRKF